MSELEPKRRSPKPLQQITSSFAEQFDGDVKTTTDEAKGVATISGKKNGKHYSVTIEQGEISRSHTITECEVHKRKSDYRDEVHRLYYVLGKKQREIALQLGISQPLVSKLLND